MKTKCLSFLCIVLISVLTQAARSQEHMKFTVLAVEYIGAIDKPIAPIVISDSQSGADWFRGTILKRTDLEVTFTHVVSSSQIRSLISVAEEYRKRAQPESRSEADKSSGASQAISVTVLTPEGKEKFLLSVPLAVQMLDGFKKQCGKARSLYEDSSHFQKRILPWAN
jgi:hypothetical protein